MSLNFILLLAISIACQLQGLCKNVTYPNSSQVIDRMNCGLLNISCGFGKICRGGVCIDVETIPPVRGRGGPNSTEMSYKIAKTVRDPTYKVTTTAPPRLTRPSTTSHSLISGNQEFTIALVGFSVLFINFCLISFCLGRMKRRRLELLDQQQGQAAAHSSQASQTGQWNAEYLNMEIDNFALNGDLDAFSSDFVSPQVRLPPYDFSSAYHKPRPMTEGEPGDGESAGEVIVDVQNIDEDPPPYSNQFDHLSSPPSYDEALKVSTNVEENIS